VIIAYIVVHTSAVNSCHLTVCLFLMHLQKCFIVAVELLCSIRKVVCSAGEGIVLIYFHCFQLIPREYSAIIFEQVGVFKCIKLKLNFTLEQAMKAQRGSRGLALLFL
jgi:hypothetical protein